MGLVLILFIFFVGGGWFIGKAIGDALFPESNDYPTLKSSAWLNQKPTIHNHIMENHLHISKDDLKSLIEENK